MPALLGRCNRVLKSSRRAAAVIVALVAGLALTSPAAGASQHSEARSSGMKKASRKAQLSYDAVLDAQKPAIVGCVMMHGISKGAPSVKLEIKVLINRHGHVFNLDLQVTQNGGDKNGMQTCVKEALDKIQFPASSSALTELRRQWTFAST